MLVSYFTAQCFRVHTLEASQFFRLKVQKPSPAFFQKGFHMISGSSVQNISPIWLTVKSLPGGGRSSIYNRSPLLQAHGFPAPYWDKERAGLLGSRHPARADMRMKPADYWRGRLSRNQYSIYINSAASESTPYISTFEAS
jgi:hypothetical protein